MSVEHPINPPIPMTIIEFAKHFHLGHFKFDEVLVEYNKYLRTL